MNYNYKEAKKILKIIKKSESILLNCHRGPDPDSIGSTLALFNVLRNMGKKVDVVCPSKELYEGVEFLDNYDLIKRNVNFFDFDFKNYDLFIILDSSSWDMVTSDIKAPRPSIPSIVVDHHYTNSRYGDINIVDEKASSTGEIIFRLFEDWRIKIDLNTANALLTAIISDTGLFRYPNQTEKTYSAFIKLLEMGANKDLIVSRLYRNNDIKLLKFWGEVLTRLKVDKENKFVYSAIPYEIYRKFGKLRNAKDSSCDLFAQSTSETDFGFFVIEEEKNEISVSFRSRNYFDTSRIALELGGGGHKAASGAKIHGKSFKSALNLILNVARKYTKISQ